MSAKHPSIDTDVTKTVHRESYPAISPTRPELSQAGKTVLITGGATGIGRAIARGFIQASASTVIITGRRAHKLAEASEYLQEVAKKAGTSTHIITQTNDAASIADIDALWAGFADKGITVDVFVSNAAKFSDVGSLLDLGTENIWSMYETNVHGPLHFIEKFYKQPGDRPKVLINISTSAIYLWDLPASKNLQSYGVTKNAAALVSQQIAQEIPAEKLHIVNLHPGLIHSEAWESYGVTEDQLPFDNDNLPGDFAVWAASPEARFLHGRFVWSSWDVDELKTGELRKRIEEDRSFLRIGVNGLRRGSSA